MQQTTVLSTVPDFVKKDDGTLVNRVTTTTQTDVEFDPASLLPRLANLNMSDTDSQALIDRETKAMTERQTEREAIQAQQAQLVNNFPELKKLILPDPIVAEPPIKEEPPIETPVETPAEQINP